MSYLVAGNTVNIMTDEDIIITDSIPIGVYKYCFHPKKGSWLERSSFNTSHSKIYGDSAKIASHIIKRYELNTSKDNFGVLLSGGKGLGKSLTVRLIVEKLKPTVPIIIVDQYSPDLPDFLMELKNVVIIMDEFDKFMKGTSNSSSNDGPIAEDSSDDMTKQESLLSVLDGVGNKLNNLYLLTCNSVSMIDTNLISRPGRIKYHYRFNSISESAIRAYCKDNLEDKSLLEDIIKALGAVLYVSFDIVKALVEELNLFYVSVPEAMEYLNIDRPEKDLIATVYYESTEEDDETGEIVTKKHSYKERYWDVPLNSALYFDIRGCGYAIDLSKCNMRKKYCIVDGKDIISDIPDANTDIKILQVKISFTANEKLGKGSLY